ncbi:MAG: diadenylate cyclase CdaA [Kiritimatiellae bacterium]|nr:diadenylate cyclase CdaA [Kiritimatiellia bacterium]
MLTTGIFPDFNGLVEIICLALAFYYVFYFLQGTRGAPMMAGLVMIFIISYAATRFFRLEALAWLLERLSVYLAVALLIIFQPEIRHALAELGKRHFFGTFVPEPSLVDRIVQAVNLLANRRIGALIAIERSIGTRPIQETGVKTDSAVTPELLASIFYPHTPLHDGGVIISGGRIVAAKCTFPLSQQADLSRMVGTRHRAAAGMSDETDAIVVVVSEENGFISIGHKGRLIQNLDDDQLRRFLSGVLLRSVTRVSRLTRVTEWMSHIMKMNKQGKPRAQGA